jgi:hypothetical protein
MIPTTLPSTRLPRAQVLTDVLLTPPGSAPDPDMLSDLRQRLQDDLSSSSTGPSGDRPIRVDAFLLRTVLRSADRPVDGSPFQWSPRTARRSIGIAAVGRCADGHARTPAAAAASTVAQLVEDGRRGHARHGSLAAWLAVLNEGGRAAVLAEAITWATEIFVAIQWGRLERPTIVGGRDRWWDCPGSAEVALRGRADVRVPTTAPQGAVHRTDMTDSDSPRASSLFTMVGGRPGSTSRIELGLAALVDVMSRPADPPPARVVGWWPDCGRALVLGVDLPMLRQTATAVTTTVRSVAATHRRQPE